MDVFDAFCHAFGTMATGGFSSQEISFAGEPVLDFRDNAAGAYSIEERAA